LSELVGEGKHVCHSHYTWLLSYMMMTKKYNSSEFC
jgi:hypothetical protein